MGYDIHLTRRADWAAMSGDAIPRDEWVAVAQGDPSLRRAPESGHLFYDYPAGGGWFDYSTGNVFTKNVNDQTFAKAHELAAKLRAKVQGDDGEVYLPNGECIAERVQVVTRYPWWLV